MQLHTLALEKKVLDDTQSCCIGLIGAEGLLQYIQQLQSIQIDPMDPRFSIPSKNLFTKIPPLLCFSSQIQTATTSLQPLRIAPKATMFPFPVGPDMTVAVRPKRQEGFWLAQVIQVESSKRVLVRWYDKKRNGTYHPKKLPQDFIPLQSIVFSPILLQDGVLTKSYYDKIMKYL